MGLLTSRIVFQPPRRDRYNLQGDYFLIPTSLGEFIAAFYIEGPPGSRLTILFSHGNSQDIGPILYRYMTQLASTLHVNVLAYDYTGYGKSSGRPSEQSVYADVRAAWDWLIEKKQAVPQSIILFGRSLGSGPTIELLTQEQVGGVILQSPFLSCVRVALQRRKVRLEDVRLQAQQTRATMSAHNSSMRHSTSASAIDSPVFNKPRSSSVFSNDRHAVLPRTGSGSNLSLQPTATTTPAAHYKLPGDMFENVSKLCRIDTDVPLLVVHGTVDRIVPYRHAKRLVEECERCNLNVTFISLENAGHNDIRAKYQDLVFRKIEQLVLKPALARLDIEKSASSSRRLSRYFVYDESMLSNEDGRGSKEEEDPFPLETC